MTLELDPAFAAQMADLVSHRIEGVARMGNVPFSVPIVSQVEGNLWQGGTPASTAAGRLPDYFEYVLNLYPWEPYTIIRGAIVRAIPLHDAGDIPDPALLEDLADWVNRCVAQGPMLVHCQAGLNRSALVAALALIRRGMTADAAIALLRERRSPAVLCNQAFERWLRLRDA